MKWMMPYDRPITPQEAQQLRDKELAELNNEIAALNRRYVELRFKPLPTSVPDVRDALPDDPQSKLVPILELVTSESDVWKEFLKPGVYLDGLSETVRAVNPT